LGKLAILISEGEPTRQHLRLARILDFFGVPWRTTEVSRLAELKEDARDLVLFGPAETLATALNCLVGSKDAVTPHAAYYAYTSDNRDASEGGLRLLWGSAEAQLQRAPAGSLAVSVSREPAEVTGAMAGIAFSSPLRQEDYVLILPEGEASAWETVISAGGKPVFVRSRRQGPPVFVCASSHMVDLDQAVGAGFYDVKDHFCSAVPLVLFVRLMFPEVSWRPQELGACLIIDDPLLRPRYGSCDFNVLRNAMQRYEFTTNIAFIPWNWRRTSRRDSEFFKNEPGRFSISVHGCDHIEAEFGATSPAVLTSKTTLAQSRMRNHEARTGIRCDPVMVFPQGVFSSVCPAVLKRAGFLAAVNTEVSPADSGCPQTQIRDVWDVAIMRYGCFPIFTRRYAHHGLENFAFDLLLGKPCLIVAHHGFFQNNCAEAIELVEKLKSLNCHLQWRSLAEVIRRACRYRFNGSGAKEVEMFGNELLVNNPFERVLDIQVRKKERQPSLVDQVQGDGTPVTWTTDADQLVYSGTLKACSERELRVVYREQDGPVRINRPLRFELSVAGRRMLSEFRDDYLSKSRLLSTTAASVKTVLTRVN
jgi:hypothetical protein